MISNYCNALFYIFLIFSVNGCTNTQVLSHSVTTANELIGKSYLANDFRKKTLIDGYEDVGSAVLYVDRKITDYAYTHLTDTLNKKNIIIFEHQLSRVENNINWKIIDVLELKDLPKNQQLNRLCHYKLGNENEQCVAISGIKTGKLYDFQVFNVWIFDIKNEKIIKGNIKKCECFKEDEEETD